MKQDVMSCSAVEPKCPCYAAMEVKEAFMGNPQFKETNYYGAESFSAETSRFNEKLWRKEYTTEGDFVDLMEIKKGTGRGLVLLRNRNGIVDGPSYWDSSPPAIEWIEDILGNSDWELIIADQLGALSEAPVLAKGHYDDEGNFVLNSNVAYYFGNYQIEDWGEVLDREGEVFFHRASFSKAAESHGYSYAYNDGHSDARKRDEYRPNLSSTKQESDFKKILKQKAEFSDEDWDGPFTKELRVRIDSVGGQFAPDWANEMEIEVQYHDESDLYAITDSITDAIKKTVNNNNESLFGAEQKTFEMQPIDKEMMKKFREFRKQMRELPQAEKDKRRKLAMKDREDYLKRKGAETFNAGPNQKPYQIQIGDKFTCGHNIGDAEQPYHDMGNIYADCSSCGTNREIESVGELCEVCGDTYAEKNILLNHAVCKGCWHKNASVGGLEHSGVLAKNAESFAADVKHQCGKCGNSYANLTKAEKCCTESNTIKYGLYGLATLGGISLLSYLKK